MFITLEILCGLALALIVLYCYLTIRYNFWTSRGVPGPKPTLLFGNIMKSMFGKESLPQLLTRNYNDFKNEPMVGIFLRTVPVLMVKDPDLIKDILIKDFSKFANRGFIKSEPAIPLSNHLFSLEAKRWRPLRTQLSPVFTSGKLRGTFSLILECSNHLESYLNTMIEKGDPIDVRELAARFTTDVIGSCAFGIEMNSLSENESDFRRIGKQIFSTDFWKILRIRIRQILPPLHVLLARILPYDEETKMIMGITRETIEYREKNKIVRPDFMNILMELKRHPERVADIKLSDDLLAAQTFIFFAAGFETSSTTISNALYELALNHDIQDKLREEIEHFAAKNDGEWKYETIKQMQYLDKVFQETLRKYPALPFLSRESVEDYTFENTKVTIPKETLIWVPVFPIHRDPEIYPDPEKFDPERFSEDKMKERNPMYYLPFGHGPRNCVGARFAIYQTKIGLIKILHKNKVGVCSKTPIPYEYNPLSFVLTPTTGLYLTITKVED
ncbi:cytochrome P450 6a14 [Bombus impatiens]|uniref:Cytochrome P450 6a14 n=1 Tax=Bombus impatiens TaxID=132113 RepID=A0A6P9FR66_BOMIM|nr:cytochrome P450 6a14 [Bombus impatiens]